MFLKDILVVLHPSTFLGVFHYFGHHGRPASQIFNPRLSFNYFNPAIILNKKLRFGRFNVWFGTKGAKNGDFGHLNFSFGQSNMSKLAYISRTDRGKNILAPLFKKNQFDQV